MSVTKQTRVNFASVKNPLPYPDFLEVQLKSFRDFLQLDTPTEKRKNQLSSHVSYLICNPEKKKKTLYNHTFSQSLWW